MRGHALSQRWSPPQCSHLHIQLVSHSGWLTCEIRRKQVYTAFLIPRVNINLDLTATMLTLDTCSDFYGSCWQVENIIAVINHV